MAIARVWMTTPCAAWRSFWARRMFAFCRNARLTASASESGWGMAALVVERAGWAPGAENQGQARTMKAKARRGSRLPDFAGARALGNGRPKPEGRRPKEVASPKSELVIGQCGGVDRLG